MFVDISTEFSLLFLGMNSNNTFETHYRQIWAKNYLYEMEFIIQLKNNATVFLVPFLHYLPWRRRNVHKGKTSIRISLVCKCVRAFFPFWINKYTRSHSKRVSGATIPIVSSICGHKRYRVWIGSIFCFDMKLSLGLPWQSSYTNAQTTFMTTMFLPQSTCMFLPPTGLTAWVCACFLLFC